MRRVPLLVAPRRLHTCVGCRSGACSGASRNGTAAPKSKQAARDAANNRSMPQINHERRHGGVVCAQFAAARAQSGQPAVERCDAPAQEQLIQETSACGATHSLTAFLRSASVNGSPGSSHGRVVSPAAAHLALPATPPPALSGPRTTVVAPVAVACVALCKGPNWFCVSPGPCPTLCSTGDRDVVAASAHQG